MARPADAPELARLAGELGYPATPEAAAARLVHLLARRDHTVLVAELAEGRLAGWIHAGAVLRLESDPAAEIGGLIVDAAQRGKGIGERLVEAAAAWAEREGYREIRVRSNVVRVEAHRFYERLGFTRTKVQQAFRRPLRGT